MKQIQQERLGYSAMIILIKAKTYKIASEVFSVKMLRQFAADQFAISSLINLETVLCVA